MQHKLLQIMRLTTKTHEDYRVQIHEKQNYVKENLPITTQKSGNLIYAIPLSTDIFVPENVPKVERRIDQI